MGDRAPGPGGRNAHRCTPQTDHMARQMARIGQQARSPASLSSDSALSESKESIAPRWNGLHSGCRRAALPRMLPLRQPSLLLQLSGLACLYERA